MRSSHTLLIVIILGTAAALWPWQRTLRDPSHELLMTVWGMPFEDLLFEDHYARGFEARHPGLAVNYQRYYDVIPKYEAWHAVGRGADVMRTPINVYHAMVSKGMVRPLDEYIADPVLGLTLEEQTDYFPQLWDALAIDGVRYALPSDNAQYGLYYNKTLFDAHNAAHPDDPLSYPHADWTWDDLRRAARLLTLTDATGRVTQNGIAFDLWAWPFLTFLYQAGAVAWDPDQTTALINTPAGVEALELIVTLVPRNAPIRSYEMADTASGPDALFKVGRLAMLLDGSWRAPNIELDNPGLDFAIAPLPRHRRRAVISGSVIWCISAHSRNPEMAWRMIRWLTDREQSLTYWNMLRVAPPARLSVIRSDEFRSTAGTVAAEGGRRAVLVPPMPPERFADRAAWLEYAITPDPQTGERPGFLVLAPYQADLEAQITRAIIDAVRGEKSPQAALDEAVRATHAIIDRDRAARGLPAVVRHSR
ncbi:MAG: extracellular solute-binding protein [Phycisphaerales bacterium]|nr:extracellular solute-binding protein [Phycisphaerales bacterium]